MDANHDSTTVVVLDGEGKALMEVTSVPRLQRWLISSPA